MKDTRNWHIFLTHKRIALLANRTLMPVDGQAHGYCTVIDHAVLLSAINTT